MGEGLPKEGPDGFPNAVAPMVEPPMLEGLPKAGAPDGFPKPDAPNEDVPKDD